MGHLEPQNPNEQMKKDDDGLNVEARIRNIYSKTGFAGIDGNDLRGRMRWMGLYTQRKQGIDGGKTAILEPRDLEDEFFMMRVRIPGGQLSNEQLRVVANVATTYGRDVADVTDRQNVQYHWIRIEDVPAIWDEFASVGMSTLEACGDTPRNILGCPVAGIEADELIDVSPLIQSLNAYAVGNKEFSNLPRKWKTSISACPHHCAIHEINDIAFVAVRNDAGEVGFDAWVGGGLSTNPMFGKRLGVFVKPEQLQDVWAGVTRVYRDWGYRRLRTRARVKFLMADWGPEKFRQVLQDDYLGYALPDGPAPGSPRDGRRDHVGIHKDSAGTSYVGVAPSVGRVSGTILTRLADLAQQYGDGRVRATIEQKLIVLGVPDANIEPLVAALDAIGLPARPSEWRRSTMACTGLEFCKLAIVETKARARTLSEELERRLAGFDTPLTINVNGCPNACARFQVADIGLKGMLVNNDNGETGEGFQVHLGGTLNGDSQFGRKFRGLKVAADELPDFVERLAKAYVSDRAEGESFAQWSQRADESFIH
jgi:sulfite reductase (ferredoxin)